MNKGLQVSNDLKPVFFFISYGSPKGEKYVCR